MISRDPELLLTAKGEEVLAKLWFTIEGTESKILSGFSAGETAVLLKWLQHLQEKCLEIIEST